MAVCHGGFWVAGGLGLSTLPGLEIFIFLISQRGQWQYGGSKENNWNHMGTRLGTASMGIFHDGIAINVNPKEV